MMVFGATSLELGYWVMALAGTSLFIIKILLVLIGGDFGGDADVGGDVGGGADIGDHGSGATFAVFSLQSILAFFMGCGWMGLACLHEFGLGRLATFFSSVGFGIGLMSLNGGLMYLVYKLNEEVNYNLETAVGRVGKCYLLIPGKGEGTGQIEITVSGRRKVLRAVSSGDAIATGSLVEVLEVEDGQIFVVKPQGE